MRYMSISLEKSTFTYELSNRCCGETTLHVNLSSNYDFSRKFYGHHLLKYHTVNEDRWDS